MVNQQNGVSVATKKKETLNQALKKYERSDEDKRKDLAGAKKLQKLDNAKKRK